MTQISEFEDIVLMLKEHANRLNRGLDIFRNIEFPLTCKLLDPKKEEKILDVGCGESILPTFIVKKFGSSVIATDVLDIKHIQEKFFQDSGMLNFKLGKSFDFKNEDATKMSFNESSFDKAFAVSSIEHIPDNGDTKAIKEMMRVVKKNGIVVVTVPCSPEYLEQKSTEYYHGFERRYDYENLKKRLIEPSGTDQYEIYFLNNKFWWQDEFHNLWYSEKLDAVVNDRSWDFSKCMFTISNEPNEQTRGAIIKLKKI